MCIRDRVTPNGSQEVYDPTQDPEIRKLFKEIYDHNRNPDNADVKYDYREAGPKFRKAQRIQYNDLVRTGCKSLIVPMCGIEAQPITRNPICSKLNWGSAEFSKCEEKGFEIPDYLEPKALLYTEPLEPCITDPEGKPVPIARIDEIGPKSTKMPYDSFEDQLDGYFKAECKAYFK